MSFGVIAAKLVMVTIMVPVGHQDVNTDLLRKSNIWPSQKTCETAVNAINSVNNTLYQSRCIQMMIPDYFLSNGFETSQSKLLEVGASPRTQPPTSAQNQQPQEAQANAGDKSNSSTGKKKHHKHKKEPYFIPNSQQ